MSSTPYDITALISNINTTSEGIGQDNGESRRECLNAARSLCFALETPIESILRHTFAEV